MLIINTAYLFPVIELLEVLCSSPPTTTTANGNNIINSLSGPHHPAAAALQRTTYDSSVGVGSATAVSTPIASQSTQSMSTLSYKHVTVIS